MPLFYQKKINANTKLAIWKIEEDENFFLQKVPLKKNISHPQKRLQHLAGRFLLPLLFSDFPLEEILIADSRKPFLQNEAYHFSISHCGDYAAAIASTTQRVGIDAELFSDKVIKVKEKFLNEEEKKFTTQYNDDKKLLTTLWCAKEATYKWYSYGLLNFKENILLQPVSFGDEGIIPTIFLKEDKKTELKTNYSIFSNLSLAWISAQ
ncbi:4-phosphopantetheinyl transferase [Arachidicoccus ginsenosidimutans]|uniref:4'-phosphopantetheinyl transferase family protein n=1 Tax=Arachidicoccus sp. BS20 TaxID=1850526 RepID=UPI0007F13308|nr:4'-phosphopantetheinyl transferase superfamily protein [Arachidicoccus sp. BS20]ANI88692.1 4-phosphopantetheinyl transferase [Arachidicoccus sp. BS20]